MTNTIIVNEKKKKQQEKNIFVFKVVIYIYNNNVCRCAFDDSCPIYFVKLCMIIIILNIKVGGDLFKFWMKIKLVGI